MKRFVLAFFSALALAVAPAGALTPHSPVFIDADAANGITVRAGEEFFIALSANTGSTGYSWTQTMNNPEVLAYEGNVSQPPGTQTPGAQMPGAPGQQIFIYHANRTGTATIVLAYTRPFEPDAPPAKTLTYTVTVQ
jgi:predicted secreted protein